MSFSYIEDLYWQNSAFQLQSDINVTSDIYTYHLSNVTSYEHFMSTSLKSLFCEGDNSQQVVNQYIERH